MPLKSNGEELGLIAQEIGAEGIRWAPPSFRVPRRRLVHAPPRDGVAFFH